MNTELIRPVSLSDADRKALSKLLLNSWSAEYALRITPVINDEAYLRSAIQWTFPQAFYSCYFSIRGVLLTLGEPTDKILLILASSVVFHKFGLYEGSDLTRNFLSELHALKYSPVEDVCQLQIDPLGEQQRLLGIVEQAAFAHETHIFEAIGERAFAEMVVNIPAYLRDSFVGERFRKIRADYQAAQWLSNELTNLPDAA